MIPVLGMTFLSYGQENELPEEGNVGIGTTNPTAKLDVRGSVVIDSTLQVNDSLSVNSSARMGEDLTVVGNAYFNSNAYVIGDFDVQTRTTLNKATVSGIFSLTNLSPTSDYSGASFLVADASGQVQKTGEEELSAYLKSLLYANPMPHAPLSICDLAGYLDHPTWLSGTQKLYSACPDVYVAIGHDQPLFHLDVRGMGYFSTGVQTGDITATGYTDHALFEGLVSEQSTVPLIRIGTRKPNGANETHFKVEADGKVYCTEVRVRPAAAIPDYVFKADYELMPLNELRTYVTTNSHLPNVPSEQEIITNGGTDMNEMQMTLLEKVEELTLYVLELDQRNAALEEEVKELKSQLKEQ